MQFILPDYPPQKQTIALPYENTFVEVRRHKSWRSPDSSGDGISDGWSIAYSRGLVCPVCCQVWGILQFDDEELSFGTSCCIQHIGQGRPRWPRWDASIILDIGAEGYGLIDYPLLAVLPPELLHREMLVHLKQLELGGQVGTSGSRESSTGSLRAVGGEGLAGGTDRDRQD